MHKVALSIGSDLGDRLAYLRRAVDAIAERSMRVMKHSSVYDTPSWGAEDLPPFLNACVIAETEMLPRELLRAIKEIERDLGRVDRGHWSARTIDIDILLYDDLTVSERDLVIPHVFMHERAFVLVPLAEVEPGMIHPTSGLSAVDLLNDLPPIDIEGMVRVVDL